VPTEEAGNEPTSEEASVPKIVAIVHEEFPVLREAESVKKEGVHKAEQ